MRMVLSSDIDRLRRELAKQQGLIQRAIAQGLNEGGDLVRTQVRHALQEQTSLLKYSSVVSRTRTLGAFSQGRAPKSGVGPARGARLAYTILVSPKPTKAVEYRVRIKTGKGGGVTVTMWGVPHKFKRSFQIQGDGAYGGMLKMRTVGPRLPLRGFYGPNLAKEALKDPTAAAFLAASAELVPPAIAKRLARLTNDGSFPAPPRTPRGRCSPGKN